MILKSKDPETYKFVKKEFNGFYLENKKVIDFHFKETLPNEEVQVVISKRGFGYQSSAVYC